MSTIDNWAVCPRCAPTLQDLEDDILESYGVVTQKQYHDKVNRSVQAIEDYKKGLFPPKQVREWIDITHTVKGAKIKFRAKCQNCYYDIELDLEVQPK
jgi:hypothetical protein